MIPVITIDGLSGSGKGTIGHLLAVNLNWHYLDSGALYRVLAYASLSKGVESSNISRLYDLALNLEVEFLQRNSSAVIFWQGIDIGTKIRSDEVSTRASQVAAIKEVRQALLKRQQAFRQAPGLVADGRDMGTVVFPDAILKVFLVADCEVRASRRFQQLQHQGINVSLRHILKDLCERDERDQQRTIAPLKPAPDAITLDTTKLTIEQVLAKVEELAKQRLS